jgi:integrase
LTPRRKPYWRALEGGFHLGYRRTKTGGGTWTARRFIGERRYREASLGVADDLQDADGLAVLDYGQAQEKARGVWKAAERAEQGVAPERGPYTVAEALDDYFEARQRRGSKGVSADRFASKARIVPTLGALEVTKTTTKRIRDWHTGLASTPKLVRTKASADKRATKALDAKNPEAVRARRSTANRILTILKAALNYAFHEGRVASDEAWRKVKPFREVDAAVVRFLTAAETVRLANAAEPPFRELVQGALLTGCRYGELTRMKVADFNAEAGVVTVRTSKAGKPRHVVLTEEGKRLFAALSAGRMGGALVFRKDPEKAWRASEQQRPLEEACRRAKIEPAATFHVLRHTYASSLAMKGVPMGVIAAQLGHSDTRMTEKHYAHLAPSYVAETVRAALPDLGMVEHTNVRTLAAR